jgi:hypothetical protein
VWTFTFGQQASPSLLFHSSVSLSSSTLSGGCCCTARATAPAQSISDAVVTAGNRTLGNVMAEAGHVWVPHCRDGEGTMGVGRGVEEMNLSRAYVRPHSRVVVAEVVKKVLGDVVDNAVDKLCQQSA